MFRQAHVTAYLLIIYLKHRKKVLFNIQYNVTVKNCRLVSTANHIQYKYYARDLTIGAARTGLAAGIIYVYRNSN